MDEASIAKKFLSNKSVVTPHRLKLVDKIKAIDTKAETYFHDNSFIKRIKFSAPVELEEKDSHILDIRTQKNLNHYIYTNWNIENESIERTKESRTFICDNVVVYENELFHSVLTNVQFHQSFKGLNPFEMDIKKPKSIINADVIFFAEARIAEIIIPQIKDIYYIMVERET